MSRFNVFLIALVGVAMVIQGCIPPPSRPTARIAVEVTCDGDPLPGRVVTFNYNWQGETFDMLLFTTNASGRVVADVPLTGPDPSRIRVMIPQYWGADFRNVVNTIQTWVRLQPGDSIRLSADGCTGRWL